MAFQNPNQFKKDPTLSHSALVKRQATLVKVLTAPKTINTKDGRTFTIVDLEVDGVKHAHFIDSDEIRAGFIQHVGQQVVLIASGNSKNRTAKIEFQSAGFSGSNLLKGQPEQAPVAPKIAPKTVSAPTHNDKAVKQYLCQAANLMRLCVKKANDIAVEMGLPPEHRQGIATTMFIQSDRKGFVDLMPISAFSPEELGFGSSKADKLDSPEPNE
jgi:hypothetical protein